MSEPVLAHHDRRHRDRVYRDFAGQRRTGALHRAGMSAFELGLKSQLLNPRLQANVALFDNE